MRTFCSVTVFSFNPRSHTGSDHLSSVLLTSLSMFQSTLPHGERHVRPLPVWRHNRFQSTLPHGERPKKVGAIYRTMRFNPRSHTGSDQAARLSKAVYKVSIHAPTRGATPCRTIKCETRPCFNPRSHTGSDTNRLCFCACAFEFQSTLPHGERLMEITSPSMKTVSIHAPTRGATAEISICYNSKVFQSTLPHGERPFRFSNEVKAFSFNPRSHTGSDVDSEYLLCPFTGFNPRSHTGSDSNEKS